MSYFHDQAVAKGRMDVRIKIGFLTGLLVLVLTSKSFLFPAFIIFMASLSSFLLKVPGRRFLVRLSEPLLIIMVLLFLKSLSGKETIFQISVFSLDLSFCKEGLLDGIKLSLRILASVSAVAVFGFCTPYQEILGGLLWFRVPKSLIEISAFTLRYLKIFFEEANAIYGAQKNRLGYSSLRGSLNSFGILAGSLTIKAFEQAQATSVAMLQRGYDGKTTGFFKNVETPRAWEFACAGIFFCFLLTIWIICL